MGGLARRAAAPIYALTLFSSAALIFTLQPLVGRMVTPLLGGAPAVWNTSMVFFQAALLAGYVYAHALARLKDLRLQAACHALVLALAWLALPIQVRSLLGPPDPEAPALWLIASLTLSAGAPFAAASATAPLLQAWFARTGRADAGDPYYLYAASNLGSFIGLLAYPVAVEPFVGLAEQSGLWSFGYAAVAALILVCAALALAARGPAPAAAAALGTPWRERAFWALAAAVPSSLTLGVTQHISTDVAAAPFLWVAPLALYLLTFVIAFARGGERLAQAALLLHPVALGFLVASYFARSDIVWPLAANLACFFVSALICHAALARARPPPARLTEFYFWISAGGVLGGAATALIAPIVFNGVYEYPLALAAVALFRPRREAAYGALANALAAATLAMLAIVLAMTRQPAVESALFAGGVGAAGALMAAALPAQEGARALRQLAFLAVALVLAGLMTFALFRPEALILRDGQSFSLAQPLALAILAAAFVTLVFVVRATLQPRQDGALAALATDVSLGVALPGLTLAVALALLEDRFDRDIVTVLGFGFAAGAFLLNRTRPRLMAALILIALAMVFVRERTGVHVVHQTRSFFGVLRTEELRDSDPNAPVLRILMHGTTIHGAQLRGPGQASRQALTYYNADTALGEAILAGLSGGERSSLALIGLGAGTTACLMRPTDRLVIFEIDPAVVRLSGPQGGLFTYVAQCQPQARLELGDARLRIAEEPDGAFDVIVVDAFSSDAIPAHLLTREAVATYLAKTSARGIVVLHLSNRHLALVSEAARVAHDLGAAHVWRVSSRVPESSTYAGLPASAMILARSQEVIDALPLASTDWRAIPVPPGRPWSDDYINVPRALWESLTGVEDCRLDGGEDCEP